MIKIPYARASFCSEHFIQYYERRVLNTINRYDLLKEGDKVLIAVSGGKDSIALLSVLSRLRKELNIEIVATHINLGMGEFSNVAESIVIKACNSLGVKYVIPKVKEVLGASVPEIASRVRRAVCSVCGVVKRYFINSVALALNATSVATGHNMDDLMSNIVKEFLNMNLVRLNKLIPRTEGINSLVVGRIRPLYEVTERENLIYVLLKKLPFVKVTCPYMNIKGIEFRIKKFLVELDINYPGIRLSFLRKFSKTRFATEADEGEIKKCRYCGLISRGDVCSFCRLTKKVFGKALGPEVRGYIEDLVKAIK